MRNVGWCADTRRDSVDGRQNWLPSVRTIGVNGQIMYNNNYKFGEEGTAELELVNSGSDLLRGEASRVSTMYSEDEASDPKLSVTFMQTGRKNGTCLNTER